MKARTAVRTTARATRTSLRAARGGARSVTTALFDDDGRGRFVGVLLLVAGSFVAGSVSGVVALVVSLLLALVAGYAIALGAYVGLRSWTRGLRAMHRWHGRFVLPALPRAAVSLSGVALVGLVGAALTAHALGMLPWQAVVATVVVAFAGLCLVARRVAGQAGAKLMRIADATAAATGVPVDKLRVSRGRDAEGRSAVIIHDAHKALQADLAKIDGAVARDLGNVEVVRRGDVLVVQVASAETIERRRLVAASEGLVVAVSTPDARGRRTLTLDPGVGLAQAAAVASFAERELGASLIEWAPVGVHRAVVAELDDEERAIRSRLAELLGLRDRQHEVGLDLTRDEEGIARVDVRAPMSGTDAAKRLATWRQLLTVIPGGHDDWAIEEDALTGAVALERRPKRVLPSRVPLVGVLPAEVIPGEWNRSVFGIDAAGTITGHRLDGAPHTLIGGPTDSGKTAALTTMLASRLMRGHELVIIDPVKGVDFEGLRPFSRRIADTFDDAAATMRWLLQEAERRKTVLKAHRAVKWLDLQPDVREMEGVNPLTVVVDELSLLFAPIKEDRALAEDDPMRVEQREKASAKAIIDAAVNEIAAGYRFVGLFLVLATQKALVSGLGANGSTLRSNCGNSAYIHVVTQPEADPAALDLLFSTGKDAAAAEIKALNDSLYRGLCVTQSESGMITALRVAWAPADEVTELLRERGVPAGRPIDLGSIRPEPKKAFGEVVEEVEDIVLDLSDLNLDF